MRLMTAEEAANTIRPRRLVAFSGFTGAATPKAIPAAIVARASTEDDFTIGVLTGASTGPQVDDALAPYMTWRAPYQSSSALRNAINKGYVSYTDVHLSDVHRLVKSGVYDIDTAIVEVSAVRDDGRVRLTSSIGSSDVFLEHASLVILEFNSTQPVTMSEYHDIIPVIARRPVTLGHPLAREGSIGMVISPSKIVGVVVTNEPERLPAYISPDETSKAIAGHVAGFLAQELSRGSLSRDHLTLQIGVGNVGNAVLGALGEDTRIPPFQMYSEVLPDSAVPLLKSGRLRGISATAFSLSPGARNQLLGSVSRDRVVLRPVSISNHPALIRQFDVVAINTALEVDLFGNVNSTHIAGTKLMNGIGGSGDFTPECGHLDLCVPLGHQGVLDLVDCPDCVASRPLGAFGGRDCHRARRG